MNDKFDSPPFGMITVPYWEYWLHHNPFRKQAGHGYPEVSCRICCSDTGCRADCPYYEIQTKFTEIKKLMNDWLNRS